MNNYRNVYETPDLFFHHAIDQSPSRLDYSMHLHLHYEIYLFVSGDVRYLVENNEYPLKPGTILLMRPMEYHMAKIVGNAPYERYCTIFPKNVLDFVDPQYRLLAPFRDRPLGKENLFTPDEFPGVDPLEFFKSMEVADSSPAYKRTAVLSNLYPLLWELSKAFCKRTERKTGADEVTLTDKILKYINRHLFEEMSVQTISRRFYISDSYLHRLFKNAVGTSVWNYILFKRLSAAQREIQNGATAAEACRKCGFKDYSAFYRAYKKQYGASPTDRNAFSPRP